MADPHTMVLAKGFEGVDLEFLGRSRAIACLLIQSAHGVALVDPGPATCRARLDAHLDRRGIRWADVTDLLITHIHLDHSGGVGVLTREHPHLRVWVHERGAPHLIEPGRLVESAGRLYGADMQRLWGEVAPVAAERVRTLVGAECIDIVGRQIDVAYTPGHASHHVSFFDRDTGIAMVGDTAGVCVDGGYVLPPTPPPDIDLDAWQASVQRIEAWAPTTLFLTHFGPVVHTRFHLRALIENLEMSSVWVKTTLDEAGTDAERAARFAARVMHYMRERMPEDKLGSYPVAAPFEQMWLGLARYWRKRATRSA